MDLASIKPSTVSVDVKHPGNSKPTGLVIDVGPADSPSVKKVRRRHNDKILQSRGRRLTAEQVERNQIEILAAAIVGWTWNGDAAWGGAKLEFTPENVEKVLAAGWVRSQVEEVLDDEAGFFTS
jgi:hypothetical protein